jgi:amidophosphoribosyltransferase
MLREAGAVEVHVRISSPPVQWPCFYGIDFATRAELIANGLEIDGIRRSIGADSLGYVSLDGLVSATEQPRTRLCMACFDGNYPIELPAADLIGKHLLEGVGRRAALDEDYPHVDGESIAPLLASPGGAGALHHP